MPIPHVRRRPPSIRCASIAATSLALILVAGGVSRAENAEAEALFNDGNRLIADGQIAEACTAFEASNRIEPRAGTLIHLGACRERNGQLASAWSAYKDALTRAKDPVKRALAASKAAALEARLSYLTVAVPAHSQLDGLTITRNGAWFDPALWNRALPVDGGDYIVRGRAPDHQDWQLAVRVAVEGARISVPVPRLTESPRPATPYAPPTGSPGVFTPRRKIAIGLLGASAIGAATGAWLGIRSQDKQSEALGFCPSMMPCNDPRAIRAIHTSYDDALGANVAFGVAATAAIGAAVLWLTGAPERSERPEHDDAMRIGVVAGVAPGGPSVTIVGRF